MKKLLTTIILSLLVFSGCSSTPTTPQKIQIITTIAPLFSLTSQLTQGIAQVHNLIPSGASIHDWEPTPQDIKLVSNADLIVINGLGLEEFIEDLISSSAAKSPILTTTKDLANLIPDEHNNSNPHVWLSPKIALQQTEAIYKELKRLYFSETELITLETNWQQTKESLINLDQTLQETFQQTPHANFLTFHNAYSYLFTQYNLNENYQGSLEEFPGRTPSPQELANIIKTIQAKDVHILFTETQFSPILAKTLSQDYDLIIKEINPLGKNELNGYQENLLKISETITQSFNESNEK